jgi:NADPH:quinone reductase-like Zn-dependent oxidoreductase
MTDVPSTMRQLRSLVTASGDGGPGRLRLELAEVAVPAPGPGEVLVRIEAAPVNPSDLGLLLAGADLSTAEVSGAPGSPVVTAAIPDGALAAATARLDQSLPVGNEAGGVVVATGSDPEARQLEGRTVGLLGGATYSEYRCLPVEQCLAVSADASPRDAAACFVNPLTALGMVETMRMEGHTALAHTAGASNLGQMLVKICQADGVDLVPIVRRPEHAELLSALGASYVCDSSSPSFSDDLVAALVETGATIAFDAIGGGTMASQLLAAMERAVGQRAGTAAFNRYGSNVHKQVYIYGGLDRGPTELIRQYGMSWGLGGWLLTNFLAKAGPDRGAALRQRVADELTTTFASSYAKEVSLAGALDLDELLIYSRQATGEKYLINPTLP